MANSEGFVRDFRRFFFRGLAAALPTLLTVAIIIYVFTAIQKYVGNYVNEGVRLVAIRIWASYAGKGTTEPPSLLQAEMFARYFWWVGFLAALMGVYVFGRFVASFIGRLLWRPLEQAFFRLPVIKQIYPSVKQVTDFLFSERKLDFSRVVAVEYPRKGVWSLGLVTGPAMRTLKDDTRADMLSVFVPSSPTPVTGYTVMVRRDEVVDLPISIDEALRYTISGGVIMPPAQQATLKETEKARQGLLTVKK